MSGNNLFVDTNILIYLLNKDIQILQLLNNKSIYISFISELELLSARNYSAVEKRKMEMLLDDCTIIDINSEVKKLAIHHRTRNRLKLPDAIIAATVQFLAFPLLTADRDFAGIKEIDILLYERM